MKQRYHFLFTTAFLCFCLNSCAPILNPKIQNSVQSIFFVDSQRNKISVDEVARIDKQIQRELIGIEQQAYGHILDKSIFGHRSK